MTESDFRKASDTGGSACGAALLLLLSPSALPPSLLAPLEAEAEELEGPGAAVVCALVVGVLLVDVVALSALLLPLPAFVDAPFAAPAVALRGESFAAPPLPLLLAAGALFAGGAPTITSPSLPL